MIKEKDFDEIKPTSIPSAMTEYEKMMYLRGFKDAKRQMIKKAETYSDNEILSDKEFEDFKYVIRTQDFFPHNVKIMNKAINLIKKLKRRGP